MQVAELINTSLQSRYLYEQIGAFFLNLFFAFTFVTMQ